MSVEHDLPFDPTHGYGLDVLLKVGWPDEPEDFVEFWTKTYRQARQIPLNITHRQVECANDAVELYEVEYDSWDGVRIGGWLVKPCDVPINRGVVMAHGYGGREAPDLDPPGPPCATLQPCARGFHRSAHPDLPDTSKVHVMHGIENRETYIHRGCVVDYWQAISALMELAPETATHMHFIGGSFGGGLGAKVMAWDHRIERGFLRVPSFGNHPLRVTLTCTGSGQPIQEHCRNHPEVLDVLKYYDAAIHARHIRIPVFCSCALFDPAVPPAGQFAVYNALPGEKQLHVRQAGHFDHPANAEDDRKTRQMQDAWFALD